MNVKGTYDYMPNDMKIRNNKKAIMLMELRSLEFVLNPWNN